MTDDLPESDLPPGTVARAGSWTVANRDGNLRAVSSRCRHQLADLSRGSLDASGWSAHGTVRATTSTPG